MTRVQKILQTTEHVLFLEDPPGSKAITSTLKIEKYQTHIALPISIQSRAVQRSFICSLFKEIKLERNGLEEMAIGRIFHFIWSKIKLFLFLFNIVFLELICFSFCHL